MLHLSKVETLVDVMMHFASLWCDLQRNYLKWEFLLHFWNNGPNRYRNKHPYDNPLRCKCFDKIIVSKFIKVSKFNENKHTELNKRKSKSLFVITRSGHSQFSPCPVKLHCSFKCPLHLCAWFLKKCFFYLFTPQIGRTQ